jgi:hypothetical protein
MNIDRINILLDQIIQKAKKDDEKHKAENLCGNAMATVGESWMVHHLNGLKELINEEAKSIDFGRKT